MTCGLVAPQEDRRLEEMIEKMADKSPPWLAKFLRAFAPFVTVAFTVLNFVGPIFIKFYAFVYKVRVREERTTRGLAYYGRD